MITWYGGSRMNEDTPLIQRLQLGNELSKDDILLFIRFEKESYSCLGRLEMESCNVSASPVQFIWRLKDIDKLRTKDHYKRVLKALSAK